MYPYTTHMEVKQIRVWTHQKYSVMARGYDRYKAISRMSETYGAKSIEHSQKLVDIVYDILVEKAREYTVGYVQNSTILADNQ